MTTTAILYLNEDPNPGKKAEFDRVAGDLSAQLGVGAYGVHSGEQILRVADFHDEAEVDHLIFVCHGFSDRLLSARAGVSARKHAPPAVVSIDVLSRAWGPKLARHCKVSLCACSCGREPWSKESVWAPSSHADGGENSFAARLRDALLDRGVLAEVRAHTSPGHVLANPTCRGFVPKRRSSGQSLFNASVGHLSGVKLDWASAKRFNAIVKGELATRWILFEGDVTAGIVMKW